MFSSEPQTGVFKTDSGIGLFDASGAIILPPRYEDIEPFYSGLAAAKLNGLWGFVDRNAHWQIEPSFLDVASFVGAVVVARTEHGCGVIDRRGKFIVQPAWDSLEPGPDKSYRVMREGQCGYINAAGECVAGFQTEPYWLDQYNQFPAEVLVLHHPDSWIDLFALADRHARRLTGFDFVWLSRPSEGVLVPFECISGDEVFRVLEHGGLKHLSEQELPATDIDKTADNFSDPTRESVSRLQAKDAPVDYHCNFCAKKIGDYAALRAAGFQVDKYDRVYCSKECSAKAWMHASREHEARGGEY